MRGIYSFLRSQKKELLKALFIISFIWAFTLISGFIVNMSSSITPGLYILYPKLNIKNGDIINFDVPENIKEMSLERNYIRKEIKTLTKYVSGTNGDTIERKDDKLFINNIFMGNIFTVDSSRRSLNSVLIDRKKIILKKGEYFVLGITEDSLDSRYFGIVTEDKVIKKAKLILVFIIKNKENLK